MGNKAKLSHLCTHCSCRFSAIATTGHGTECWCHLGCACPSIPPPHSVPTAAKAGLSMYCPPQPYPAHVCYHTLCSPGPPWCQAHYQQGRFEAHHLLRPAGPDACWVSLIFPALCCTTSMGGTCCEVCLAHGNKTISEKQVQTAAGD